LAAVELAVDFDEDDEDRLPPRPASPAVENVTSSAAIRKWVPVVVFMTSRESVRESEG
jgi:hypothetical protein